METTERKMGNGLITPNKKKEKKDNGKIIPTYGGDGLMERDEKRVITEDGRELLMERDEKRVITEDGRELLI